MSTLNEQQFADYVGRAEDDLLHWKTRAEKAERERDALREALQAILNTTMMDRQNPDIWEPRVAKARAALEAKS